MIDAPLRIHVGTQKALAAPLQIAQQTGAALLRELKGRGWPSDHGGNFCAFAI
jgi:hypothetical protein